MLRSLGTLGLILVFAANCDAITGEDDEEDLTALLAAGLAAGLSAGSGSSPIYMISDGNGGAGRNGNLGGRSGADAICAARKAAAFSSLNCTTTRAFLSVSASDTIAGMATNYGISVNAQILGPTGTKIADNWADLLDGSISDSGNLNNVGLFADVTATPPYWRTGSNSSGNASPNTCSGWTTSAAGTGSALDSGNNAFTSDELQNCNSATDAGGGAMSLLCICY